MDTPDASGLSAQLRAALKDAKSGSITRVGPYMDEQGQARLDFIAPLPMAGDKSPFIVLDRSRSDWLNNILKSWPVPDSSGEALLFRRSGDQVQFLNDVRYRPGSALTLHLPVSSKELLAAQFCSRVAMKRARRSSLARITAIRRCLAPYSRSWVPTGICWPR